MGGGVQPALRFFLRGLQDAAADDQRFGKMVREGCRGECRAGARGRLDRPRKSQPDYFCCITSSPFCTFISPTLSGNFMRSRCSASFFCNAGFTSETGTLRSPTLNSVGSKVAYPSFEDRWPETVTQTSLPAISVRNWPCTVSPSKLTCWSLIVGWPLPRLESGVSSPAPAAPTLPTAWARAAPTSSELR